MDKCQNCTNYLEGTNAGGYGFCYEHENMVRATHEACSWFLQGATGDNQDPLPHASDRRGTDILSEIESNLEPLDPEYSKLIYENYWDLI